jgi:hypothetical protein
MWNRSSSGFQNPFIKTMTSHLILLALLALPLTAADDAKPNFSGDWKMNADKSDFGKLPRPLAYQRNVDHKDPVIRMVSHQSTQMGEQTVVATMRTDGVQTANPTRTGDTKTIGRWQGRDLELTTTKQVEGGEAVTHETWSLSADGKTLTSTTHFKTPRGEFDVKMVLEKQ